MQVLTHVADPELAVARAAMTHADSMPAYIQTTAGRARVAEPARDNPYEF